MTDIEISKQIDSEIFGQLSGLPLKTYELCLASEYFSLAQDYSNTVSIKRLKMNDHGRVHMRKTTLYSVIISNLLHQSGVEFSGQLEGWCSYEDSLAAIILAAFIHDIGMGIHRQNHEFYTLMLVEKELDGILNTIYPPGRNP
jgi:uncharacterized protein